MLRNFTFWAAMGAVLVPAGSWARAAEAPQPSLTLVAGSPTCAKDGAMVQLSWTEVPGASYYLVLLDGAQVFAGDGAARTYVSRGLHPGPTYSYMVSTFDGKRISSSNPVGVAIPAGLCGSEPPGPFKLGVGGVAYDTISTIGGGTAPTVPVSWTSSEWADAYDVYRDGELLASGLRVQTFRDHGIQLGRSYTYMVRARNGKGTRDSNPATIETPPAHP